MWHIFMKTQMTPEVHFLLCRRLDLKCFVAQKNKQLKKVQVLKPKA